MLKYLFTAGYKDGSVYVQNPEDRSVKEPDKRSCYFDIDHENLAYFTLKGEGHEYGVDLRDGHFEIDGVQFFMHEGQHIEKLANGRQVAYPLKDFKLLFFRNHTHSFNVAMKDGSRKEMDHKIVYRMGWQCTVKGKNYQEVMQIH